MKPTVERNVSLSQLNKVWGYSQPDWTPIAVQLGALYVGQPDDNPERFKTEFHDPGSKDLIHEFLYLQAGTSVGNWAWGRVGSVNGVLLWPSVFRKFCEVISEYV
jgi:hypothetical protein